MNYYKVLGLSPQASQSEIKKAYFRLLREHSPESDPEGFRQIREAYEYLKSVPQKEDGPAFPPFKEPFAQRFADQIVSEYKMKNYTLVRDTAKEAWRFFPDDIFFLYWLVIAQRKCGNTGNSVKNAELLVRKEPNNKWFWREYGISLMERGFVKKAYDPMCKAYEMGIRDLDFVILLLKEFRSFGKDQKIMEFSLEIIRQETKWKKEELLDLMVVFAELVLSHFHTGENGDEIFHRFCRFLDEYRSNIQDSLDEWLDLLFSFITLGSSKITASYYFVLSKTLNSVKAASRNQGQRQKIEQYLREAFVYVIKDDDRICDSLEYLAEIEYTYEEENADFRKYTVLDCHLLMIEERQQILGAEAVLRDEYPEFYSRFSDFIDVLRDESSAASLKARLLPQYAKLSEYITDGHYFKLYPEEKTRIYGTIIASGDTTYERAHKKIGRNDPCPCGSGKKFKKCCMGKHIYD